MSVPKKFRYKCAYCKKPITIGKEKFISSIAYGEKCYQKMVELEVTLANCEYNKQLREKRSKGTNVL